MDTQNGFEVALQKVSAFCAQESLFSPARPGAPLRVAAAVSGGADSMALLRLLLALAETAVPALKVSACHVNHGLRGAAADRDEAFVRGACARLGVPLRVFRAAELGDIPPHAGEDWARQLRYRCFDTLRREGIDRVATAHTGSDQAETLLFRLARGTGLHGAAGIRPQREGYLRPLLCLTRAETEACCRALGQTWVEDETNATDAYARNRLRHAALPALESVNAAAERNLVRFCEKAARADAYFVRQAQVLLERARLPARRPGLPAGARYALAAGQPVWALEPLRGADPLILEAAMHQLTAPERDAEERFVCLLCALIRRGSGAVQLTDRVRFCADAGVFWREEHVPPEPETLPPEQAVGPLFPGQTAEYRLPGGWRLRMRVFPAGFEEKTQAVHKKDLKNQADYARIVTLHPALSLRGRRPGDHYRPAGRGVGKELRKWMNEAGVPPPRRASLPLLAAESEILWVCGAGFAEGLAPDADSRWILQIEPQNMEEVES
ncbi:MAG: tRNA lysidine(34) synthetase TilS [Faecalibacterium sp.]